MVQKSSFMPMICKRNLRTFCFSIIVLASLVCVLQTQSPVFTKTKLNHEDASSSMLGLAELVKRQSREEKLVKLYDSPLAMFPSTEAENFVCNEVKASGRCMFEQRHKPSGPLQMLDLNSTLNSEQLVQRKEILKIFEQTSNHIGLVVTFNKAQNYEVAPLIEAFYRGVFVKIVFCGPNTPLEIFRVAIEQLHGREVANYLGSMFVTYKPDLPDFGENVYTCFNLALSNADLFGSMAENGRLDGIFVMADDVLINYWNLFSNDSFNFEKSYVMDAGVIYDTENLRACDVTQAGPCQLPNPWPNWPNMFQPETINYYNELERLAGNGSISIYAKCLENIIARTGFVRRVLQSPSDFFYIAKQHFTTALAMFELANQHKVFQEVVVQTTFACFDEQTRGRLNGAGDNTDGINRKMPWLGYENEWLFMHPFKLSLIISQDTRIKEFSLNDRCLFCMLAEFSKEFRYNLVQNLAADSQV